MIRVDATTVLIHRVLICNVREAAIRNHDTCEEFLEHELARHHKGLLQTIELHLQYPMGLDTPTVESTYHTVCLGEVSEDEKFYEALKRLVVKIYGESAICSIPEPHEFDD